MEPLNSDAPSPPKKCRVDESAAGCSSQIEPAVEDDAIDLSSLHVLTDLNKLNANQTVGIVAVIKEILHNDTWGYPKCKIDPHCDQEVKSIPSHFNKKKFIN